MGITFFNDQEFLTKGLVLNLSFPDISEASRELETALDFERIYLETGEIVLHNDTLSKDLFIRLFQSDRVQPLSDDHLVIFYLNNAARFYELCERLKLAGAKQVTAFNPYWDDFGSTFIIANKFRLVLCPGNYPGYRARIAAPTSDLEQVKSNLTHHLGLKCIDDFENHRGFDGVMMASRAPIDCHLEFTYCHHEKLPIHYDYSHQVSFLLEEPLPDLMKPMGSYYKFDFIRPDTALARACLSIKPIQQLGIK